MTDTDGSEYNVKCGECGAPMRLRDSRFGRFYGCTRYPDCKGTHGAHPDGAPMGVPADKPTKQMRRTVHDLAGRLWDWDDPAAKAEMYSWLRGFTESRHIGEMLMPELRRVKAELERMIAVAVGGQPAAAQDDEPNPATEQPPGPADMDDAALNDEMPNGTLAEEFEDLPF